MTHPLTERADRPVTQGAASPPPEVAPIIHPDMFGSLEIAQITQGTLRLDDVARKYEGQC